MKKNEVESPLSEEEMREMQRSNWAARKGQLFDAAEIARVMWRVDFPTVEMVAGVKDILDGGIQSQRVAGLLQEAQRIAIEFFGATTPADTLEVFHIIVSEVDVDAYEHFKEALAMTKSLYGTPTLEGAVDAYYQVYGEEDEDDIEE